MIEYDLDPLIGRNDVRLVGFDSGWSPEEPHPFYDDLGLLVLRVGRKAIPLLLVEDPEDGYRSTYAGAYLLPQVPESAILQFRRRRLPIHVHPSPRLDGYSLLDGDGHVWLDFGTEDSDGYYPFAVVTWDPKVDK